MNAWGAVFWTAFAAELYTHVFYPAVMALCGRRPAQPGECIDTPFVSLVIPAHNEEAVIRAKLENALSMNYPPERLEILIASDGSTDKTVAIAREFESDHIRVLEFGQRRGKASVVNDAISAARGEVICLCDANVMFHPQALQQLVTPLAAADVGAVTGTVNIDSSESDFGAGESLYARLDRAVQLGESRIGSVMGVDGGMYALRRELFQPLEPDTILDDFTTAMRVIRQGRRVIFVPQAVATENGTPTARQEFRRRVRIAAGAVQSLGRSCFPRLSQPIALWQFASHKLLRWMGPVLLVLLFVSSGVLWNSGAICQFSFGLQSIVYILAAVAAIVPGLRNLRVVGVMFYFVMSHTAMAVGSIKGLFNKQSAAWARTDRTLSKAAATRP